MADWFTSWRERRTIRKAHKRAGEGFGYALSVLRGEVDPELHKQLKKQADSDPSDPFCMGMRIAFARWSRNG